MKTAATPIAARCDHLIVITFLDAFRIWEEEGGEALRSLLCFAAKKVGLDRAEPPDWIEADYKLQRRWMSARARYRAERMRSLG
jgi:hypothetical protein